MLTATTLGVYDIKVSNLIERVPFDGLSLLSPTLSSTVNGSVSYLDSVSDVGHNLRVYKGKIFILVSASIHFWCTAVNPLSRAENTFESARF